MTKIHDFIEDLKDESEDRFDNFDIEEIDDLEKMLDKAYLEKPTWLGGDTEFVCLFIDLDNSSKKSFKKQPKTMAKIYDYFTQNIVDIFNHPTIGADYIDIKGDGAFGIFQGEKASYKALYCAITFKVMFEKYIGKKFDTDTEKMSCKFGIHKDKILVRRIGKRGEGNYNEVWAGRLVNNAAKLANQSKNITGLAILLSEQVYLDFERNKEYGFYHCCENGVPIDDNREMFTKVDDFSDEILGNEFYYTRVGWCDNCADDYIDLI